MGRHTMYFTGDIPKRNVDTANRCTTHNAVTMPEMLTVHHLPKMLYTTRIFTNQQLRQIFYGSNHTSGMPLKRRFAPTPKTRLICYNFNKDPIPHTRMAYVSFYSSYFH